MAGFSFALVNVFCGFLRTYPVRCTTRGCRVVDSVRTLELQQVRGAALLLVPPRAGIQQMLASHPVASHPVCHADHGQGLQVGLLGESAMLEGREISRDKSCIMH